MTIYNAGGYDLNWVAGVSGAKKSAMKMYTLTPPDPDAQEIPEEVEADADSPDIPVRSSRLQAELDDLTGVDILFDRAHGEASSGNWSIIIADLVARGATVTENTSPITPALLSGYDVLWIIDINSSFTGAEITAIQNWVLAAGALLLEGDNTTTVPIYNDLLSALSAGIAYSDVDGAAGITSNIFSHDMTAGVSSIYLTANLAHLSTVTAPAAPLVNDVNDATNTAYSVIGAGRIVAMADEVFQNIRMGTADNQLFANQVFDWLAEIEWLTIAPSFGTVPPDDSMTVEVKFNATGLSDGDYYADMLFSSNDPDAPGMSIPAHLLVTQFICGDIDGDGKGPNISDLTYLVDFLFRGGPPPPVPQAANVDGINDVTVADLTYLVDFLFRTGPDLVCAPIE
jgi:hypothetical protein